MDERLKEVMPAHQHRLNLAYMIIGLLSSDMADELDMDSVMTTYRAIDRELTE